MSAVRKRPSMARRRWLSAFGVVVVFAAIVAGGYAYYIATATANSHGAAVADALPQGKTPTLSKSGRDVTVHWAQNSVAFAGGLLGANVNGGYTITRYAESDTGTPITPAASCSGLQQSGVDPLSCIENGLPTGRWKYTATPHFYDWVGDPSPLSDSITIAPESVPSVTLANGGGVASAYVNASNASSVNIDVSLPATSLVSDTVHLTVSDGVNPDVTDSQAATAGAGTVQFIGEDLSSLNDGTLTFTVNVTSSYGDTSGNTPNSYVKDTASPVVNVTASRAADSSGWYNHAVTFSASTSTDTGGSGIQSCDTNVIFSGPDTANGSQSFSCIDNAGNSASNSISFKYDATNPSTSITLSPTNPDGSNGWYVTPPKFTLSASDTTSGVATTKFQIDGGTIQTYPGSGFQVPVSNGQHTISYWSVDNAGNTETTHTTATIKVDPEAPFTALGTIPSSPNGTNGWFIASSVSFVLGAADNYSGVASSSYTIDGGAAQTYSGVVAINTQGDHTVTYWSTDIAGNVEATHTTHIKIDNVVPTVSLGTITDSGSTACEFINGSSVYFSNTNSNGNSCGSASGSFTVPVTANDSGSGMNKVNYPTSGLTNVGGGGDVAGSGPSFTTSYTWGSTSTGSAATVTAYDNANNQATAPFSIKLDNTAPSGTITAPSAGNVNGSVSLSSTTAADNVGGSGVKSVAYYRCSGACGTNPPSGAGPWTLIGSGTAGPSWSFSWDTTNTANGSYTLKAVVTDNVGNQTVTAGVSVTVNNSNKLVITSSAVSGAAMQGTTPAGGPNLGPITVQLQNPQGTPVNAGSGGFTVNLSGPAGSLFATSQFGGTVTSVSIPNGSSSTTFWYGNTNTGTPTITAAGTGVTSGTQQETITTAPAGLGMVVTGGTGTPVAACGSVALSYTCNVTGDGSGGNVVFKVTFVNSTGAQVVYSSTQASTITETGQDTGSATIAANASISTGTLTASHTGGSTKTSTLKFGPYILTINVSS